ncbi:hypothetical protein CCACVL1_09757 [Corchorus capsularis]|uniref:Uncharacterized protein n=1 Tax=Corchorus capsularis TaxID=210143 RepID=A0A1R3IUC1_COCAP|nr:hypothetical protein CCACVL1_09757 [Corchorus capsularis]
MEECVNLNDVAHVDLFDEMIKVLSS